MCLVALGRLSRWTYGPKIWHTHCHSLALSLASEKVGQGHRDEGQSRRSMSMVVRFKVTRSRSNLLGELSNPVDSQKVRHMDVFIVDISIIIPSIKIFVFLMGSTEGIYKINFEEHPLVAGLKLCKN